MSLGSVGGSLSRCTSHWRNKVRNALDVWLPDMDSNHDKQIQSLLCYRYTIRQVTEGPYKV